MYALIAKCEAIANSMEPVEQLAQQVYPTILFEALIIKLFQSQSVPSLFIRYDIKRTLERLERLCK